mmetsp:Transcript_22894/g.25865  ORF Transcript_22894/g.25865 Transcript_22894/m.25865 type:complete len:97 (-) Transcript_22894:1255-1545(-)
MSSCIPVTNSLSKKNNTNQNPTIREEAEMRTLPHSSLCIKSSTNLQKKKEQKKNKIHINILEWSVFLTSAFWFSLSLSLSIYIYIFCCHRTFSVWY